MQRSAPGALRSGRLPQLEMVIRLGEEPSAGMLNFETCNSRPATRSSSICRRLGELLQFDDPINVQFTSGTTGAPKGATLSHHNILNNGYFIGEACA